MIEFHNGGMFDKLAEQKAKLPRGWKLYDDQTSAIDAGTPFQVGYFLHENEKHLFFKTKEEAFRFVQDHPECERPEIKNVETCERLFPKGGE